MAVVDRYPSTVWPVPFARREDIGLGYGVAYSGEPVGYLGPGREVAYEARAGWRLGPWHNGVDLVVDCGSRVVAPWSGVVLRAGMDSTGYGLVVMVRRWGYVAVMAHMSQVTVTAGQHVVRGALVGASGGGMGDGRDGFSTGCHLHYAIYRALDYVYMAPWVGHRDGGLL